MSISTEVLAPERDQPVEIAELCRSLFWCLARADQRRWAETYVRGLLTVAGRKSIRRISEQVVGYRADQSLQQFLNQSPWDCGQVRANLAHSVRAALRPKAWVFAEVAFPKHGSNSVAVCRQFAPSLGRTVNCQLGIATVLASDRGSCPVNWRLTLPRSWDTDGERRSRARVPAEERHRPWWRYVLDSIGEMADGWALPPAPVLVDCRNDTHPGPLLHGLDGYGLRYAELASQLRLPQTARTDLQRMNDDCGLRHFEGRSFGGWHHHVTLVSVAHAYRVLTELGSTAAALPYG